MNDSDYAIKNICGCFILGMSIFGLLWFIAVEVFIQPEIMVLDISEKETNGYRTIHVELAGIKEKPDRFLVHFTNGLVSDSTNTLMEMEQEIVLLEVFYPETPLISDLKVSAVVIDEWFVPLHDTECPDKLACSTKNMHGEIIPAVYTERAFTYIILTALLLTSGVALIYPKEKAESLQHA